MQKNNEHSLSNKIQQITKMLNSGSEPEGIEAARSLALEHKQSTEALNFLANVEEQLGSKRRSIEAHKQCLQIDKSMLIAYLSLGYLLAQDGAVETSGALPSGQQRTDEGTAMSSAIALFWKLLDISPQWFFSYQSFNFSPAVMDKLIFAGRALVAYFDQLNKDTLLFLNDDSSPILEAVWPKTHLKPFTFPVKDQQPHLYYVPDIKASPIWQTAEATDFPWVNRFLEHHSQIVSEFSTIASKYGVLQSKASAYTRPYLDGHFSSNNENDDFSELAGKQNWTALDLYRDGKLSASAQEYFPHTLKALSDLPLCGRGNHPDEVFFSILQPGQEIPPHYGLSNHSLTVHLGIDVPANCELCVENQSYEWKNGDLVIFDDSFIHSAKNNSDKVRVVLLFSIWHPELSDKDIAAIKAAFVGRAEAIEKRDALINELLG